MTSVKNIYTQILQTNIENLCNTPTSFDRVRHLSDVSKVFGFRLSGFSCGTIFFQGSLIGKYRSQTTVLVFISYISAAVNKLIKISK